MHRNCLLAVTLVVVVSILHGAPLLAQRAADLSCQTWNQYLGSSDSAQFSSLDQIDRSNVDQLEVVWSYPTGGGNITFPVAAGNGSFGLRIGQPDPAPGQYVTFALPE